MPPASPESFAAATYRKVTLRFVPFLLICYIAAYLDRVNVGFAKLQMQADLSLSDFTYGLGAGIFFAGYFIFEVPSNLILSRIGARRWIARIMVSWGVLSGLTFLVSTPHQFYLMRFLLGIAEAGFFPGVILYLTYWFPAQRRGQITSLFMTAIALSGLVGGPLSGAIMKYLAGAGGLAGWQWLFLLEGVPSLVLGVLCLFVLEDRIGGSKWLTIEERAFLAGRILDEDATKFDPGVGAALVHRRIWHMSLIYFCIVMALYGVSFWLPTVIQGLGVVDILDISLVSAIPWGFAVVAMVLVARRSDRLRQRRVPVAGAAMVGAIGLWLSVALADHPTLAIAALTLATMGIMSSLPLFWSMPTAFLAGSGAAAGIALINSLGNLAGYVSPTAVGWLKQSTQSTNAGMYLLAIMLVIGAVLTLAAPSRLVDH